MIGLLTALPRTPLYARMKREGRLREVEDELTTRVCAPTSFPRP